jgi:hypothetical protein
LPQKHSILTQIQSFRSKLISELFLQNFCEFEKNGYEISEL